MNEVDPRFSRWFMRNAVLFAKEYEKKEKKERLEKWLAFKKIVTPSILHLVHLFFILLWIFDKIMWICDKMLTLFCFLSILCIFIIVPCSYSKDDTYRDICPAYGYNVTSELYLSSEKMQCFYGTMYFLGDLIQFTNVCNLINPYHII